MNTAYPCLVLFLSTIIFHKPGRAAELEGQINIVGSSFNSRPVIILDNNPNQQVLCPGPMEKPLRMLGGTVTKLTGDWSANKGTKEKCFQVASFAVTQISKGKPAYIGTLIKEANEQYVITDESSKRYSLERASKGLKKLEGKKVITDLVPATQGSAGQSEQHWKVVSYMEYPTP